MSKEVAVLEMVHKYVIFPLCEMVHFREDSYTKDDVGIEHLETDLGWIFYRSGAGLTVHNYENIGSEDVLSHPFSFQPPVNAARNKTGSLLSHFLDKFYFILTNTQMTILNFMKTRFMQKPSFSKHIIL